MAGSGFMGHAINSLRNNKSLLRKKSMFKKERSLLNRSKNDFDLTQGQLEFKTVSEKELKIIKEKIIKKSEKDKTQKLIFIALIFIPIALFAIQYSIQYKKIEIENAEKVEENYLIENINKYSYVIEVGDSWIEKGHWNNAIFKYKQAIELFPKEFEPNYRLALAYSYKCKFKKKDCQVGRELNNQLLKYFPERKELLELKKIFN